MENDCAAWVQSKRPKIASVLLLCGLPASGKSTLARKILDLYEQQCYEPDWQPCNIGDEDAASPSKNGPIVLRYDKVLMVDYDSLCQQELVADDDNKVEVESRKSGFCSSDLEAWRKTRVVALEMLNDALMDHFTGEIGASSLLIIMDDNFHLRSMRRDVYRSCQEVLSTCLPSINDDYQIRLGFSTVHFSTPREVCLQRNELRAGKERVPVGVIDRMALAIEPPDAKKPSASFESFYVSIDSSGGSEEELNFGGNYAIEKVWSCLNRSLQSPILPKIEISEEEMARLEQERIRQREETLKCQTQKIDQLLRKLVGAVSRTEKSKSRKANEARKSIMDRLRGADDALDKSVDSILQQFACLVLGADAGSNDWQSMENSLVQPIKDAFENFGAERNT